MGYGKINTHFKSVNNYDYVQTPKPSKIRKVTYNKHVFRQYMNRLYNMIN